MSSATGSYGGADGTLWPGMTFGSWLDVPDGSHHIGRLTIREKDGQIVSARAG